MDRQVIPENWVVRDIRWSTKADERLPAFHNTGSWVEGYANMWTGSRISRVLEVHSLDEFDAYLTESKNVMAPRIQVIIPHNIKVDDEFLWSRILLRDSITPPPIHHKMDPAFGIGCPALALTLDRRVVDAVAETSIIIPHWESFGFLRLCLWSLNNVFNAGSKPKIIVVDDNSSEETFIKIQEICSRYESELISVKRSDFAKTADVGALLDIALQRIHTSYVCMLDADTCILDRGFLEIPLRMLNQVNAISVGLDTGLGDSYHISEPWQAAGRTGSGIQLPGYQCVTNNLYRTMRTEDAKAVSLIAGFTRGRQEIRFRDKVGGLISRIERKFLNFTDQKFSKRLLNGRLLNSRYPVMPPTADNGVAANHWMDINFMGPKVTIPITSYGYLTPSDGVVFQNISGLLIHVALSTRALSAIRREVSDPGVDYLREIKKIVDAKISEEELASGIEEVSRNSLMN